MSDPSDSTAKNRLYIGMGSNHRPEDKFRCGMRLLREQELITVLRTSPVYETPPAGNGHSAAYLNAVIAIETPLQLIEIKVLLQNIEAQCGRVRRDADGTSSSQVALDLDILLFNDWAGYYNVGETMRQIPSPDIYRHAHIAIPLSDLLPDVTLGTKETPLRDVAEAFDTSQIKRRDDVTL
jgi:2-amino-4-hydroxy-6-hydroxymethyldihydropteridine diphosphokinase